MGLIKKIIFSIIFLIILLIISLSIMYYYFYSIVKSSIEKDGGKLENELSHFYMAKWFIGSLMKDPEKTNKFISTGNFDILESIK